MSKKNRRDRKAAPEQLSVRAARELAKGNAKEALKDARVCYRGEPTTEHRELLERALAGRAQQLYNNRLWDEAGAVLDELAALVPALKEVESQLVRLQVLLGKGSAQSTALVAQDAALMTELIDEAIVDSQRAQPRDPAMAAQVALVRQALVQVEQGADAAAIELLKDIPRTSPLSDWRLFIRGLSAFYLRDAERCADNWRRLDAKRPAWHIAQTLRAAAGELADTETTASVAACRQKLMRTQQGAAEIAVVRRLVTHWQEGDWRSFMREFRSLRQTHAKTHPKLIQSIVDLTWKRAVRDDNVQLLNMLSGVGPAPPLDPHWYRARALSMGGTLKTWNVGEGERLWTAHAAELAVSEQLSASERPVAAALIYRHLARCIARCVVDAYESPYGPGPDAERIVERCREAVARYYRKSIESYDGLESAYTELAGFHDLDEEPDKAAAVFRRLIAKMPDHYEAHLYLANYHLEREETAEAEPHAAAALRIKPRDRRTLSLKWHQQLVGIRCLTKKRQFDAARQALEQASESVPPGLEPYALHIIRAGIEFKAKCADAAHGALDAAIATVDEPAPIWLNMSCTAARFNLPRELKKDFDERFKAACDEDLSSASIGRIARFFYGLRVTQVNYTGRATQERLFLEYLSDTEPSNLTEEDLTSVCRLLVEFERRSDLRQCFVNEGVRRYQNSAYLNWRAGEETMALGPFCCDFRAARFYMRRALTLAEQADNRDAGETAEIIDGAQRALALLAATTSWMPFTSDEADSDEANSDEEADFARYYGDEEDEEDEDWDDDEEDLDEYDDEDEDDEDWDADEIPGDESDESLKELIARMRASMPPEFAGPLESLLNDRNRPPAEVLTRLMEMILNEEEKPRKRR